MIHDRVGVTGDLPATRGKVSAGTKKTYAVKPTLGVSCPANRHYFGSTASLKLESFAGEAFKYQ